MQKGQLREYTERFYPAYYQWLTYNKKDCVSFLHASDEWGIFSNFGNVPLIVSDIRFKNSEQLFHCLKFRDKESLSIVYQSSGLLMKKKASKRENCGFLREDWGRIYIDVMKFCLTVKYEQCELFRQKLEQSRGKFIIEQSHGKTSDTWNAKDLGDIFEGSNLMGRLLMELRDNGKLDYNLPEDIFDYITVLKE